MKNASLLRQRLRRHEELERVAQSSPEALRRRLFQYAVGMLSLPVLFIAGCILLAAAGVVLGFWLVDLDPRTLIISALLVIVAGMGVYVSLNGLTAPVAQPVLRKLVPADYPELFAFVEETRRRAGGPPVDAIVVRPFLNAAVREDWDSLLARRPRNTLIIGLDLMEMLDVEEFRSTLAHEMGHLAARDTYYNTWASRMLLCWGHILDDENENAPKLKLLAKFWKRFDESYSMLHAAVSRQAEIRADRIEASVTSPEVTARALLRLGVYNAALASHEGRATRLRMRGEPVPPPDTYMRRLAYLRTPLAPEIEAEARHIALSAETTFDDSHPALRQRLAALGVSDVDSIVLHPVDRPATVLLGARREVLVAQMEQLHRREILDDWRAVFETARRETSELAELNSRTESGVPRVEDEWRRCEIETAMAEYDAIIPLLDGFVDSHPDHPRARFLRGLHLLGRHREEGVADVEYGMSREPGLRSQGFGALGNFLFHHGRYDEMLRIAERVDAFTEDRAQAEKERESLGAGVPLSAHRLSADRIEAIVRGARTHPRVSAASVVRAKTSRLADEDFHVVVVEVRKEKGLQPSGVRYHIGRELDFPHRIVVVPGDPQKWVDRAREVPGSLVFER